MLRTEELALTSPESRKNEQQCVTTVHTLPQTAVLMDALRSFEVQLQSRGMIEAQSKVYNPIWFVAETERNVFLWRRGCSLIQKDDFEFWIDLDKLLEKRLKQLQACQGDNDNPFLNPLWGVSVPDKETAAREADYLLCFREIISKINNHLHALSQVTALLSRQLSPRSDNREVVLLPAAPRRPGV